MFHVQIEGGLTFLCMAEEVGAAMRGPLKEWRWGWG
jgi:hypothetical protein